MLISAPSCCALDLHMYVYLYVCIYIWLWSCVSCCKAMRGSCTHAAAQRAFGTWGINRSQFLGLSGVCASPTSRFQRKRGTNGFWNRVVTSIMHQSPLPAGPNWWSLAPFCPLQPLGCHFVPCMRGGPRSVLPLPHNDLSGRRDGRLRLPERMSHRSPGGCSALPNPPGPSSLMLGAGFAVPGINLPFPG